MICQLLLLAPCVPTGAFTHAAQGEDRERVPPLDEGPLQNDVFLPTDAAAQEALSSGDTKLTEARSAAEGGRERDANRLLSEAFEAWRSAMLEASRFASVWADPGAPEPRLTIGLGRAIEERLRALSPDERRAWGERFEPLARNELEAGPNVTAGAQAQAADWEAWVELANRHPATASGARALLRAGDLAWERGSSLAARTLWERAAESLELCDPGSDVAALERALGPRREVSDQAASPAQAGDAGDSNEATQTWRQAERLVPIGALPLALAPRELQLSSTRPPPLQSGVRPGLVFLEPDRFAVQTPKQIHVFRLRERGRGPQAVELVRESAFEPSKLVGTNLPEPSGRRIAMRPPGWTLPPASDGETIYFVHGRAEFSARGELEEPNALMAIRVPTSELGRSAPGATNSLGGGMLPELRWAVAERERWLADGTIEALGNTSPQADAEQADAESVNLEGIEFQPGVCLVDDLVLVQGRQFGGDVRAWLLAFERNSGRLRWARSLARGVDLVPDLGRFSQASTLIEQRLRPQELLRVGDDVFAGTHLGCGALLAIADGEPRWSLAQRRRDVNEPGWSGAAPRLALADSTRAADVGPVILWSPVDSDRAYALRARPKDVTRIGAEALFAATPRPVGESRLSLGGTPETLVVAGRSGPESTISSRGAPGVGRVDALYLGPDERLAGRGLVTESRVFAASDRGVYLFDRERELYLLDYAALALESQGLDSQEPGGDLYAAGSLLVVCGRDAIWCFRAE